MARDYLAPVETVSSSNMNEGTAVLNHDAFGVIKVGRTQVGGKGETLFGSDLTHRNLITIEISRAHLTRANGRDWINDVGGDGIVRLEMSGDQWATFISSAGVGEGTPVTLVRAPARGTPLSSMPGILSKPKRDVFESELREVGRKGSEAVRSVEAKLREFIKPGGKPPSKKDIEALLNDLRHAGEQFEGNLRYVETCFHETMESNIEKAKIEVASYVNNLAQTTGLNLLAQDGSVAPVSDGNVSGLKGVIEP